MHSQEGGRKEQRLDRSSIQIIIIMKDKVSQIGNLDWEKKELMHWVRTKPKGMRVDIRVLWRIRSIGTLMASVQVLGGCEEHVGEGQSNEICS